jgi:uncharacterized protein YndB with AHSA1/START domain
VRIEHEVVVARPPEDVFAFVAEPENLPRWQTSVVEIRKVSQEPGPGARHVEVRSFMGKHATQTVEVVRYEPPTHFDIQVVEGPVKLRVGHTFEPVDGGTGTRVALVAEAQLSGLMRLTEPMIAAAARMETHGDLHRLERALAGGD